MFETEDIGYEELLEYILDLIKKADLSDDIKAHYTERVMRTINTQNKYYNLLAECCAINLGINAENVPLIKNTAPYVPIKDIQEATEDRIIDLCMSSMMTCDICGRRSTTYDPVEQTLLFPYGEDGGVIPINYCHTCYLHRSDRVRTLQTNISSEKEE